MMHSLYLQTSQFIPASWPVLSSHMWPVGMLLNSTGLKYQNMDIDLTVSELEREIQDVDFTVLSW